MQSNAQQNGGAPVAPTTPVAPAADNQGQGTVSDTQVQAAIDAVRAQASAKKELATANRELTKAAKEAQKAANEAARAQKLSEDAKVASEILLEEQKASADIRKQNQQRKAQIRIIKDKQTFLNGGKKRKYTIGQIACCLGVGACIVGYIVLKSTEGQIQLPAEKSALEFYAINAIEWLQKNFASKIADSRRDFSSFWDVIKGNDWLEHFIAVLGLGFTSMGLVFGVKKHKIRKVERKELEEARRRLLIS